LYYYNFVLIRFKTFEGFVSETARVSFSIENGDIDKEESTVGTNQNSSIAALRLVGASNVSLMSENELSQSLCNFWVQGTSISIKKVN
jgi:hypothetical protein